jgi:hypothetical protein
MKMRVTAEFRCAILSGVWGKAVPAWMPAALMLAVATLAAPAHAAVRPPGVAGSFGNEQLSDELSVTRWAYPQTRSRIRTAPRPSAHSFARLHYLTEEHAPEVYIVLRSQMDTHHHIWFQIRVPGRPNGRTGWVLREQLSVLHVVRTMLRISRRTLRATLYRAGSPVWTSRVGVGKASTPTPGGHYWVRERIHNLGGNPAYGPWALGTSAYAPHLTDWPGGGVIGIHGTNQPQLIPGRPSHGCIRVPNRNITRLVRMVSVGTPIVIV